MRLLMLGTGPFAVPTLQALASSNHDLVQVVTRPPRGRAKKSANPMRQAAHDLQLETWDPETVNAVGAQEQLRQLAADLLVVCDYGEILKPATLDTACFGGINLHGSLLPKYRGAAPVQWAILNGEQETGNSVIQMTPGLDAGPCLAQEATPIDPEETAAELESRLAILGAALVCRVVDGIAAGRTASVKQDPARTTKAPRLQKADGALDWSQPSTRVKNQIRAMIPWPRAFTFWHRPQGEPLRLNIDKVSCVAGEPAAVPGTVLVADKQLVVQAGDGGVEICRLQAAGRRPMPAAEFLRGNRVLAGDRLGPV